MIKKLTYSKPKLCHFNYDLKKQWYIHFRCINPDTNQRQQHRIKGGINYLFTKSERINEANIIISALIIKLKEGWNPFIEPINSVRKNLINTLNDICALQWTSLRERTVYDYKNHLEKFIKWLEISHKTTILPTDFLTSDAQAYMDYLTTAYKINGRTYNNNLLNIKVLFNYLVNREIIDKNPFRKIKKQGETSSTKNMAFTDVELHLLNYELKKNHTEIYFFAQFIFYCFIRPKELTMLKIENIDFKNYTINIPSYISKNKKNESVVIPNSMLPILEQMDLQKFPKNYFIFGKNIKPSIVEMKRHYTISEKIKTIILKLNINPKCTLYSYKHTGIISAYKLLKFDIYSIMKQCRHYDISITQNYLKSLGLVDNSKFREFA